MLFIIPVLALLWIPGILHFTTYPDTTVSYFVLLMLSVLITLLLDMGRRLAVVEYLAQRSLGG